MYGYQIHGADYGSFYCVNLAGPQCSDLWSNLILDFSVRVFLNETNLSMCRLTIKLASFYNVSGSLSQLKADENKTLTPPSKKACGARGLELELQPGVFSLPAHPADVGLSNLHNHMSHPSKSLLYIQILLISFL